MDENVTSHAICDELTHKLISDSISYDDVMKFNETYNTLHAFDIGGGNCSAAWIKLANYISPTPLTHTVGIREAKNCWSVIGYSEGEGNCKYEIGKQAFHNHGKYPYVYTGYKKVPSVNNLNVEIFPDNQEENGRACRELTTDFIRKFAQYATSKMEEFDPAKAIILIGHPSDDAWRTPEAQKNLKEIIREATGVQNVITISESNAAIVQSYKLHADLQQNMPTRCIIIDLGAYSLDITYIDREKLIHKEFSIPLGAGEIEKNLIKILVEKCQLDPARHTFPIAQFRIIKENRWSENACEKFEFTVDGTRCSLSQADIDRAVTGYPFMVRTNEDINNNRKGTVAAYVQHLKNFLTTVSNDIDGVDQIYIVGGAARMTPAYDTICETAKELWGLERARIWPERITDETMIEAVPHGAIRYFCNSLRTLKEIPKLDEKLKNLVSDKLCMEISCELSKNSDESDTLASYFYNKILLPVAEHWANEAADSSINDFCKKIEAKMADNTHHGKIKSLFQTAITSAAKSCSKDFGDTVKNFMNELYGVTDNQPNNFNITNLLPDCAIQDQDKLISTIFMTALNAPSFWDILLYPLAFVVVLPLIIVGEVFAGLWELGKSVGDFFKTQEQLDIEEHERFLKEAEDKRKAAEQERQKMLEEREKIRSVKERRKIFKQLKNPRKKDSEKYYSDFQTKIFDQLKAAAEADGFGIPAYYLNELKDAISRAVFTG